MYNPQVTEKLTDNAQPEQASNTNMNSDTSFNSGIPSNPSNNYSNSSSRINNNEDGLNNDKNQAAKHSLSSTTSEYRSSDDNTRSEKKPVADKNAFVETEDIQKHWQHSMEPGDRAKELAEEMKQGRTGDDLTIKIGDEQKVRHDK